MKVWRLFPDEKKTMEVTFENPEHFLEFDGRSLKDNWTTPILEVIKKGRHHDFPYLTGGIPVFGQKAVEVLRDLISNDVELLEAHAVNHDIKLTMVNVTNVIDGVVDYENSDIEWSPYGKISYFRKIAFHPDKVASQVIFKAPEHDTVHVYVTDTFRDAVLRAKLKGLEFVPVWDSEITPEKEREAAARYKAYLAAIERNKGPEFDWAEAVRRVGEGRTVLSERWKMKADANGNLCIARLEPDCRYAWLTSAIVPPILLGLKWHEAAE